MKDIIDNIITDPTVNEQDKKVLELRFNRLIKSMPSYNKNKKIYNQDRIFYEECDFVMNDLIGLVKQTSLKNRALTLLQEAKIQFLKYLNDIKNKH